MGAARERHKEKKRTTYAKNSEEIERRDSKADGGRDRSIDDHRDK